MGLTLYWIEIEDKDRRKVWRVYPKSKRPLCLTGVGWVELQPRKDYFFVAVHDVCAVLLIQIAGPIDVDKV